MPVIAAPGAAPVAELSLRPQRGGSSGFSVPMPMDAALDSARVARTERLGVISGAMVLALQEQVGRDKADEQERRRGRQMLDELARLQRALLCGAESFALDGLQALAGMEPGDVDPGLGGALRSIRLRARIELERRGRGGSPA